MASDAVPDTVGECLRRLALAMPQWIVDKIQTSLLECGTAEAITGAKNFTWNDLGVSYADEARDKVVWELLKKEDLAAEYWKEVVMRDDCATTKGYTVRWKTS
jgi:hypothetical protein